MVTNSSCHLHVQSHMVPVLILPCITVIFASLRSCRQLVPLNLIQSFNLRESKDFQSRFRSGSYVFRVVIFIRVLDLTINHYVVLFAKVSNFHSVICATNLLQKAIQAIYTIAEKILSVGPQSPNAYISRPQKVVDYSLVLRAYFSLPRSLTFFVRDFVSKFSLEYSNICAKEYNY